MHHAVLHRRKFPLNAVVYPVGDGVGLYQGQISIRGELYIHIDAGTELPGLQQVQPLHSLLAENDVCHLLFQTGGGCVVGELTYRIPEDAHRRFQDKNADDQTGHRVQHRKAQPCPCNSDETAHRGRRQKPKSVVESKGKINLELQQKAQHQAKTKAIFMSLDNEKNVGEARVRKYYHLTQKGADYLTERERDWHIFTTAVQGVLGGDGCVLA